MIVLKEVLKACACCPRRCGVDRFHGELGFCGIGADAAAVHAGLHFGEEPPISGERGSGTIFFAGCNLRCIFCQNYQISQEFRPEHLKINGLEGLVHTMLSLQGQGAHNVNFVSPSHVIFQMAEAVAEARKEGFVLPVVYNSNGYDSVDALRQIRGLVDIFLPDLKYMDDALGFRLSGVDDYSLIAPQVLKEMLDQAGQLETSHEGVATRGVLVRHLVLPGELENSRQCLAALHALSPHTHISLMAQYSPQYKACEFPGMDRTLKPHEYREIVEYAMALGLDNVFIQEVHSHDLYLPDFSRESPFGTD